MPRATSRPLVLLEDQLKDLFRLQRSEVLIREAVERFLERISHVLWYRAGEEELPELGGRFRGRGLSAVDPVDHNPEAAENLKRVGCRAVSAVAAFHDAQEPRGIRLVAVVFQMDDAVREVHRDDGLRSREIPGAVLLEGTEDGPDLSGLLEHVADQVPLFIQAFLEPDTGGDRSDPDAAILPFQVAAD